MFTFVRIDPSGFLTILVVPHFCRCRVQRTFVVWFYEDKQIGLKQMLTSGLWREQTAPWITSKQALYGQQNGAHIVQGRPLVFQDVQTDETLIVHVGVETRRDKSHTRSLVGVACRKVEGQPVPEALVHLTGEPDHTFMHNVQLSSPHVTSNVVTIKLCSTPLSSPTVVSGLLHYSLHDGLYSAIPIL